MAVSPGFTEYVIDLLADFGPVEVRRMFGAAGVFRDDVMFAVIDEDVLYLKADDAFARELEEQGATRWVYSHRAQRSRRLPNNWSLPEGAADDPQEACQLAARAYQIAAKKKRKKR